MLSHNTTDANDSGHKRDKVTISAFSKETGPGTFGEALFSQKENLIRMAQSLKKAATDQNREPPEIVLSVLLIPDWSQTDNSYDAETYKKTKAAFMESVRSQLGGLGIVIQDIYEEGNLTAAEKAYMHKLEALGSNADIIKNRAIINNQDCRHLQIDSNTIVKDYKAFYAKTFGAAKQKDALNASYYDTAYLSAHNKVVYTAEKGKIGRELEKSYLAYINDHQNDLNDKGPKKNSIYARAFTQAMVEADLAIQNFDVADNWNFCCVNLDAPEYDITSDIVTAVNMSWSAPGTTNSPAVDTEALKKLDPVRLDDARCDFQSFSHVIKKYTGYLYRNAHGKENPSDIYEKYLNICDTANDLKILSEFYKQVMEKRPELMDSLAKVFPDTSKGNLLTQVLFGCDVQTLHSNSKQTIQNIRQNDIDQFKKQLITIDRDTMVEKMKRAPLYITSTVFKSITGADLDSGKLSPDSSEEKIYKYILAIEEGDVENLVKYYKAVESIPEEWKQKTMAEGNRILTTGSDGEYHFNYIPKRIEALKIVQKIQVQVASKDQPQITLEQHQIASKAHYRPKAIKHHPHKPIKSDKIRRPKGVMIEKKSSPHKKGQADEFEANIIERNSPHRADSPHGDTPSKNPKRNPQKND